ncbi:hypothetical protein [Actinokineospora alba]|uniref:hypothetical protein n=1 Tax=Actinokineospora alba TaxID=504798 RepID=UPI001061633E|nr:hypothetical protein [Actinokineospora alba]
MNELENVLSAMGCELTRSGQLEAAQNLLEFRTATAAAGELLEAIERGDRASVEFHTELLGRQVREGRPLNFQVDG